MPTHEIWVDYGSIGSERIAIVFNLSDAMKIAALMQEVHGKNQVRLHKLDD